jgi:hypothetical protein
MAASPRVANPIHSASQCATPRDSLTAPRPNNAAKPALVGQRMTFAAWVYTSATNLTGGGSAPLDVIFR